jgi:hypothetical protein
MTDGTRIRSHRKMNRIDFNMDDIQRLIRENILPRLDAHEAELWELRGATWPVCQAIKDKNMAFRNIKEKRRFFRFLDRHEIRRLLGLKAAYARIDDVSLEEEIRMCS